MKVVTCVAPVNIAVIKYWGKRDEELILPINDSISASLSTDIMCAKTTIMASPSFKKDRFWLNGKEESFDNPRLINCLKKIKERCTTALPHLNWHISICSENNFPTAAGLASSAAGYACLVSALAKLYEIEGDISGIARLGSGSACRSIHGGWVQWLKGSLKSGDDSIAKQIVSAGHWPEMRVLVLVVSDDRKKCGSTFGMNRSVKTSTLINFRSHEVVPERIERMKEAIFNKNFQTFSEITMKDSNQFHAICLDTYPPCMYMNDRSHEIVHLVHCYNDYKGTNKVAYTFDAGPNACIYLLDSEVDEFLAIINYVFPKPNDLARDKYFRGLSFQDVPPNKDFLEKYKVTSDKFGVLKYVIHTKVGDGPKVLDSDSHLLTEDGLPKNML